MRSASMGLLCALAGGAIAAPAAWALPVSVGAGFDYYQGPGNDLTRTALAIVAVESAAGHQASLVGVRFDDSQIGSGNGLIAGVGLAFCTTCKLRAWGSRFIGDEAYRSWRVKMGPWLSLPLGAELGFYYAHFADNMGASSEAAMAEFGVPLLARFTARATAGASSFSSNQTAQQGTLGLDWSPIPQLTLSGEAGVARNGSVVTSGVPSGRRSGPPVQGGGRRSITTSQPDASLDPTFQLGLRLTFP